MGIEKKILRAIEKGQEIVSARNPVFFFIRGRGQRIGPALLSIAPHSTQQSSLGFVSQQAWSYKASKLSFEHWERPKPTLASICPAGGYRRRQNLFRWMATRICAGDPVPEVSVAKLNATLQTILKRSRGWSLVLFQGSAVANEELQRFVSDVEILNVGGLEDFGKRLLVEPDASGHMAGISEMVVFPSDDPAESLFGVCAQCLFLVRPDLHVGLRAEPIREGVVLRYFKEQCNMTVPNFEAPASAPLFDPLPFWLYIILVCLLLIGWWFSGHNSLPFEIGIVVCVLVLIALFFMTRPPH